MRTGLPVLTGPLDVRFTGDAALATADSVPNRTLVPDLQATALLEDVLHASAELQRQGKPNLLGELAHTIRYNLLPVDGIHFDLMHHHAKLVMCKNVSDMRYSPLVKSYSMTLYRTLGASGYELVRGSGLAGLTSEAKTVNNIPGHLSRINLPIPSLKTILPQRETTTAAVGIQHDDLAALAARQTPGSFLVLSHDEKELRHGFVTHKGVRYGETDFAGFRTDGKPDKAARELLLTAFNAEVTDLCEHLATALQLPAVAPVAPATIVSQLAALVEKIKGTEQALKDSVALSLAKLKAKKKRTEARQRKKERQRAAKSQAEGKDAADKEDAPMLPVLPKLSRQEQEWDHKQRHAHFCLDVRPTLVALLEDLQSAVSVHVHAARLLIWEREVLHRHEEAAKRAERKHEAPDADAKSQLPTHAGSVLYSV